MFRSYFRFHPPTISSLSFFFFFLSPKWVTMRSIREERERETETERERQRERQRERERWKSSDRSWSDFHMKIEFYPSTSLLQRRSTGKDDSGRVGNSSNNSCINRRKLELTFLLLMQRLELIASLMQE